MGGVLVDYTADNATWHFTDDPEIVREIHNVMFCSQEWMALDMGSITDEEAISRILPRLSDDKVREVARIAFDHWHEYNNVERTGVAEIIKVNGKTSDFNPGMKENTLFPRSFFLLN